MKLQRGALSVFCGGFLLLGASQSASAAVNLFIDPYVGWSLLGETTQTTTTLDIPTGKFSGLALGGRVGISIVGGLFAGADINYLPSLSVAPTDLSYFNTGAQVTRLGAVLGFSPPVLPIRFWVGYNFMDKLSQTLAVDQNGVSSGTSVGLGGNGMKAGVGFTFIPFVSLNAEYILSKYTDLTLNGVATPLFSGVQGINVHSVIVSASLPLSLPF